MLWWFGVVGWFLGLFHVRLVVADLHLSLWRCGNIRWDRFCLSSRGRRLFFHFFVLLWSFFASCWMLGRVHCGFHLGLEGCILGRVHLFFSVLWLRIHGGFCSNWFNLGHRPSSYTTLMVCGLGWGGILILADILIRSAIVITSWVSIRHLEIWHFVWTCSVPGWSYAGSWIFRWGANLMV